MLSLPRPSFSEAFFVYKESTDGGRRKRGFVWGKKDGEGGDRQTGGGSERKDGRAKGCELEKAANPPGQIGVKEAPEVRETQQRHEEKERAL